MKLIYNVTALLREEGYVYSGTVNLINSDGNAIQEISINHDGLLPEIEGDWDLISNKIQCLECGNDIESKFQHDLQYCACGNTYVDGGLSYNRWGGSSQGVKLKLIFSLS